MSRWDYGKGLPSVINGTAASEEQLQQEAREVVARKLGIDPSLMVERRDKRSAEPDLGYAPIVDLKPTKILHKPGEYGHPKFWKSEKEMTDYLTDSGKWSKRIKEFRQDPNWVAAHNKRFPSFPTKQLPKQSPQYGVKKFSADQRDTFPYNQGEALATADAMDKAVANTKTRINQIHKNPAAKIAEKQQSIKDLQRVTDIAYKYSNDHWEHKPQWELDKKTGSPIDVADPKTQNDKTVRQLQKLKTWSQGDKVNAPHVKLHAAGTAKPKPMPIVKYINTMNKLYGNAEEEHPADEHYMDQLNEIQKKGKSWLVKHLKKEDANAGVRYIPREERIQHHYDTLEAERSKRRNARFI